MKIYKANRTSRSIAVEKTYVKPVKWVCRLENLKSYLKTDVHAKVVKILGRGVQGKVTLMKAVIPDWGVLNYVQKLIKVDDDDYSVLKTLPKSFRILLDDDAHLVNTTSDYARFDLIFKNKRGLLLEPIVELAGLILLSQCVSQKICPNFPVFYGVVLGNNDFKFDLELARGCTFAQWTKTRHGHLEWNAALFQVLIGMHVMHTRFGMTHDDLHSDNVIVDELPAKLNGKPTYIHYKLNGYSYYVPTFGKLFLIIDFGRINSNVLNIKWHRKLISKDRKAVKRMGLRIKRKEAYDYYHFVQYLTSKAPKSIKKDVLDVITDVAFQDVSLQEFIQTYFNSTLNSFSGKECKDGNCMDVKPKGICIVGTYNIDKKIDLDMIPSTLRTCVNN